MIKNLIKTIEGDEKRTGWYLQQFLKYSYACRTENEYYLTWDSDTIPLHHIDYFKEGKPTFITKTEYHKAYFRTIDKLFDGKIYRKKANTSYVAENMMFNAEIVRQIIEDIDNNKKLVGSSFYEKIMRAIEIEDFNAGFSEFETYGNYVSILYPQMYNETVLKTFRRGGSIIGHKPNASQINWAAKDFDIVSLEGREFPFTYLTKLEVFRKIVSCRKLASYFSKARGIKRKIRHEEIINYD